MALLRWLLVLLTLFVSPALAEKRVALIVANAAYDKAPLANPTYDAALIGPMLGGMGFEVETVTDADFIAFSDAVDRFAARARGADVALFYFAGHGFAINADRRLGVQNYLMATSADVTARDDRVLRRDGIPLDDIVAGLTEAAKVSLVFIDACRNDPRVRATGGTGRGLTRLPDPGGANVFVGLSTRLGDVAEDGAAGEGSPFARAFAVHLPTPGLRLDDAFAQVRVAVTAETGGAQRPEAGRDDLDAALVLVVPEAAPDPPPPSPPLVTSPPSADACTRAEAAYAEAKDLDDAEGWRTFLSAYPNCLPETGFAKTRLARLEAPLAKPPATAGAADDPPEAAPSTSETVVAVVPPEPAPPRTSAAPPFGTLLRTLEGHGNEVASVAVSPDGTVLASASFDNTVKLWRVADGNLLRTLEGHGDGVWSIAFSPDGTVLASGSFDNTVKLWRVIDGSLLRTFEGQGTNINSVAFSPDGTVLASADKTVKLWRIADGTLLRTFEGHGAIVLSVAFSPDGTMLASAYADNTVKLWRVADGRLIRALEGHNTAVWSVAFSPDGAMLASGSDDQTAKLWRVADGTLLRTLEEHVGTVNSVAFSPDGTVLACGSLDKIVKLWRVADGTLLRTLEEHVGTVNSVAFSPDGTVLACGSLDKIVKLWRVADGTLLRTLEGHGGNVSSVAFSPDGAMLASGSYDRTVKLWSLGPPGALAAQ